MMRRDMTSNVDLLTLVPLTGTGLAGLTIGALMAGAGYIVRELTASPVPERRARRR
jgi:hypothetical protein